MEDASRIIFPYVDQKLRGARYHLNIMTRAYSDDRDVLDWELDAFLGKTKSVFDILLFDINEALNLGVVFDSDEFRQKKISTLELLLNIARDKDDKTFKFIKLLKMEKERIEKDQYYKDYLGYNGVRNRSYHSIPARANVWILKGHCYITTNAKATLTVISADGTTIQDGVEVNLPELANNSIPKEKETSALAFIDYEYESMLETCRYILDIVEEFVNVIRSKIKPWLE